MYKVEFSKKSLKELKKTDKTESLLILAWIRKNLEGCDNPRLNAKALKGNMANLWRYRIGNYRLTAEINDEKVIILIINIGHRKDIYTN
ncbi:type II toxin-antitoxin system RelE family toxin [Proteocatella sphenisci]|uniref:type II toxin-antitoxin system RelE family toxin n=1 Tax=Proteocatella sphenisci TaxID=181070 RepID=UPI00048DE389|nr:type II toxin-antitoxin system RelE/ParE family toxin [Proteocatella sphenisci]